MRNVSMLLMLALLTGCRHDWREAEAFASGLRCGMTREDVQRLASQHGVEDPIRSMYEQDGGVVTVKSRELDFVDIWLQDGKAVAVQRGRYVAFTTGMELGPVRPLCGRALPANARERARETAGR